MENRLKDKTIDHQWQTVKKIFHKSQQRYVLIKKIYKIDVTLMAT